MAALPQSRESADVFERTRHRLSQLQMTLAKQPHDGGIVEVA